MEWLLELALVGLLAATLFHAVRLERALGVLKRDRVALEELVAGFNASTRAAEHGIERLRQAADGAGRQLAGQIETAQQVQDDLRLLSDRGDQVADRLEIAVRTGRRPELTGSEAVSSEPRPQNSLAPGPDPEPADGRLRSQAERELLKALRMAR